MLSPEILATRFVNYFSLVSFNQEALDKTKTILAKIQDSYSANGYISAIFYSAVGNTAIATQIAKFAESLIIPEGETSNTRKVFSFIKNSDWKYDGVATVFISNVLATDDAEQQQLQDFISKNGLEFIKILSFDPAVQGCAAESSQPLDQNDALAVQNTGALNGRMWGVSGAIFVDTGPTLSIQDPPSVNINGQQITFGRFGKDGSDDEGETKSEHSANVVSQAAVKNFDVSKICFGDFDQDENQEQEQDDCLPFFKASPTFSGASDFSSSQRKQKVTLSYQPPVQTSEELPTQASPSVAKPTLLYSFADVVKGMAREVVKSLSSDDEVSSDLDERVDSNPEAEAIRHARNFANSM